MDDLDGVVIGEHGIDRDIGDEGASSDQHSDVRVDRYRRFLPSKSSASRSMNAGRSCSRKSVPEGAPSLGLVVHDDEDCIPTDQRSCAFCVIVQDAMRTRSSPQQMGDSAAAALHAAFSTIGLEARPATGDGGADIVIRTPDGALLSVDIKTAALPTADWVARLRPRAALQTIVVADQIPTGVRQELNDRGVAWLDRRGHLRFVGGGLFIDADVPTDQRSPSSDPSRLPIRGRSGFAAAVALLIRPDGATGVGEIARSTGMSASSISRAMAALAGAQLAERLDRGRYRPLAPELFWTLADVWPAARTPVQLSTDDLADERLGAHVSDLEAVGWAMGGERGAVGWGAPLVLTGDYPTVLYVPDEGAIRRSQVVSGEDGAKPRTRGPYVELAVDPVGLLTRNRYAAKSASSPLAHPVACALDLAATSRGREALDQWDPPEAFTRVW